MPSKFRKAIGAVKDQTSISLAKVTNSNASNLEILILRATTHEEIPIDERYLSEILALISSNKLYARACALFLGKRLSKTRNWVVAIKSLILVLRIFQDGDPYFPKEILHATKRGSKILNLSSFRDDSNKNPWDYTAFVRTYALYLDERLDCFITGKLQRRYTTNREMEEEKDRDWKGKGKTAVCDMKPPMLLDKITHWQLLLDRAIATRPTGSAKTNKLVKISLYTVLQESFELYKDISDGLALLLDSFFHLQYKSCLTAFHACVKATRQFEELSGFYDLCKSIGIGRTSEYPSVQKISEELVEILHEFLKDQSSFPANGKPPSPSPRLLHSPPPTKDHAVVSTTTSSAAASGDEAVAEVTELTDRYSDFGSYSNSLEDFMSPSRSSEDNSRIGTSIPSRSHNKDQQTDSNSKEMDFPIQFEGNGWELALIEEPITNGSSNQTIIANETVTTPYNPFLDDVFGCGDSDAVVTSSSTNAIVPFTNEQEKDFNGGYDLFSMATPPTFQATTSNDTPSFRANEKTELGFPIEDDLFGPSTNKFDGLCVEQPNVLLEQQLWLQNQDNIISRHVS